MNTFKIRKNQHGEAEVFVDGESLITKVKKIEESIVGSTDQEHIAGGYSSLSGDVLFLPSRHLLDEPVPSLTTNGKAALLLCSCGCEGCWDFVCKITLTNDFVIWSEHEQIHRDWDYSSLGSLTFLRSSYEAELTRNLI